MQSIVSKLIQNDFFMSMVRADMKTRINSQNMRPRVV